MVRRDVNSPNAGAEGDALRCAHALAVGTVLVQAVGDFRIWGEPTEPDVARSRGEGGTVENGQITSV